MSPNRIDTSTITHKKCTNCELVKEVPAFPIQTSRAGNKYYSSWCRDCTNRTRRTPEARRRNLVRNRGRRIQETFGISHKEYLEKAIAQGHRCAICNKSANGRNFHLDHCHATGQVRDFLCRECNMVLGLVNEDTEVLTKIIQYLKKYRA